MQITDQFVETAMGICLWIAPVIMVVGASWPIFLPPRKIRSWPYFTRPLFGVLTAQAGFYGLLFCVVRPLENAQISAHQGNILLDYPVDILPPIFIFVGAVLVSYFLFGIHACWRAFSSRS